MIARRAAAFAGVALAVSLACGCAREREPETPPEERAQAMIDEGNQAYATGDYRLAARRYAAAAVVRKDDPAAYYGLGMALSKLGRDEEARTAYARAKTLAQGADDESPEDAGAAGGR